MQGVADRDLAHDDTDDRDLRAVEVVHHGTDLDLRHGASRTDPPET
jgi:hypothetical protein